MTDASLPPAPDPVKVAAAAGQPWWVLPLMGMVAEGIFLAGLVLAYMLENTTLFNVGLGAAIGQAQMVVSYFFGSSAGSAKKDDTLAASVVKKDETIAASTAALAVSVPPAPVPPSPAPAGV